MLWFMGPDFWSQPQVVIWRTAVFCTCVQALIFSSGSCCLNCTWQKANFGLKWNFIKHKKSKSNDSEESPLEISFFFLLDSWTVWMCKCSNTCGTLTYLVAVWCSSCLLSSFTLSVSEWLQSAVTEGAHADFLSKFKNSTLSQNQKKNSEEEMLRVELLHFSDFLGQKRHFCISSV